MMSLHNSYAAPVEIKRFFLVPWRPHSYLLLPWNNVVFFPYGFVKLGDWALCGSWTYCLCSVQECDIWVLTALIWQEWSVSLALLNVSSIMNGLRRHQLPTFTSFLLCLTVVIKAAFHPNIKILSTLTKGDSDLLHKITVIGDGRCQNNIKHKKIYHNYCPWWIKPWN